MRNGIKRLAAAGGAAAIVALALSTPARAETTLLMLMNKTPFNIQFYVDGQPACSASPDTYCQYPTSSGTHAVFAKRSDAEPKFCEAQVEIPPGLFMWSCEVQS
ncbi:MAG: hypothetical protein ACREBM_01340 [Sphingomicrobium sp.]